MDLSLNSLTPEVRVIVYVLVTVHVSALVRALHTTPSRCRCIVCGISPTLCVCANGCLCLQMFWCCAVARPTQHEKAA